jgi:hypothetical protein
MSAHRRLVYGLVIAASLVISGCISARMEMGRRVDPALLETRLQIGQSTRADVLATLGEPNGRGRGLLPIDTSIKTIWSYYYEESTIESNELKDSRRMFLWVYLDGDRYDGYMWFSSLLK